jgi:chromosome partitioning protein
MISVLVTNPKGGCGKTLVATHLAAAFANAGERTVLADTDRQRSSLGWLAARPSTAASIEGADWVKDTGKVGKRVTRLVIDTPAGLRIPQFRALVRKADVVVVPVLPSAYDQQATEHFLAKLKSVKSIKEQRKPYALLRNRVRQRSRAAARLDYYMLVTGAREAGRIDDRALYAESAWQGLSAFDLTTRPAQSAQEDWSPLLSYIAEAG